jgi:hypothetical protein
MPVSKGRIISDIELRLSKGKPSDDLNIRRNQIAHWLDMERDNIIRASISESLKIGNDVNPLYVFKDECLSPVRENDDCVDCEGKKRRFFITLTNDVMNIPENYGILRMVDSYGKVIPITSQHRMEMFQSLPFGSPTKKNQIAYRENKNIFIEKISLIDLPYFEYDVFYIPLGFGQTILESEDYPIEDDLLPILIDSVVKLGLKQMNEGVSDLENDGTDPSQYAK